MPQTIGLAEYTNANFLSKDTMFEYDELHDFVYPQATDAVRWEDEQDSEYLKKLGKGDTIYHIARTSLLYHYRQVFFPQYIKELPIGLDTECYKDYASHLIPRAVGYSAGLLEYFFRGQIDAVDQSSIKDASGNTTGVRMKVKNSTPDEALGPELNAIMASIEGCEIYSLYEDLAFGGLIRTENGTVYSYPITFMTDENGLWKIRGL